jgi:hypothetical protein
MRYSRSVLFVFALGIAVGGSSRAPREVEANASVLAEDQCAFFAVDGKNDICHRTGSAKNPYNYLSVSEAACVSHADHEGDFVTSGDPASPIYDPTCNGQGCLPEGAPFDGSIECCEGLAPRDGVCAVSDQLP